ncbi:MAG: CHC2 zinc finger domain-containing protein [Pseudomonadota bacterium]
MSSTRNDSNPGQNPPARGRYRPAPYIKWAALKKRVGMGQLLARYDWMRYLSERKSGQLVGPCPIHTDGEPSTTSTSFKVTSSLRGFKCWGCGAKGSIIDFVAGMENVSPTAAGKLIHEWFPEDSGDSSEALP